MPTLLDNIFKPDDSLMVLNAKIKKRQELGEFKTPMDVYNALKAEGVSFTKFYVDTDLQLHSSLKEETDDVVHQYEDVST